MSAADVLSIRVRAEAASEFRRRNPGVDWSRMTIEDLRPIGAYDEGDVPTLLDALADAQRELDARFEHSDHQSAKYYKRMRLAENAPNLGLATTGQLLDEIRARIEIDYFAGGGGLLYTTVGGRPESAVSA